MFIAHSRNSFGVVEQDTNIQLTEVTDTRVKGTCIDNSTQGYSHFDVKRQPGNKFYRGGNGSAKDIYYLKQVSA